jgi:hypothetical protein
MRGKYRLERVPMRVKLLHMPVSRQQQNNRIKSAQGYAVESATYSDS